MQTIYSLKMKLQIKKALQYAQKATYNGGQAVYLLLMLS